MDKKIWYNQLSFNKILFKELYDLDLDSLSVSERTKFAKDFFFYINKELTDLINCLPNWKMHYRNDESQTEIVSSNLVEEYVDVFKYFMGLGQILGVSLEDVLKGYENKTEVIKQKYEQNKKFNTLRETEVILFDIDGVINNYPVCYLDWLKRKKSLEFSSLEEMKSKTDFKTYENLKSEYRLSGEKRKQPVNEDTVKLMRILKENGNTLVLFTNRPVSKFKVIYPDTLYWLKNNNIPFDAIYWSDYNQKEDIYKLKFRIKYIVEDNIDNAKNFVHENYTVYLLNKDYNQDNFVNSKLVRINNPLECLYLRKE